MAGSLAEVLGRLRATRGYRDGFAAAYRRPANTEDLAQALTAFLETLETPADSAFDRGREDRAALPAPAGRGLILFSGKARCLSCHQGPLFADHRFHDLGLAPGPGPADPGRWAVVPTTGTFGAFLTPGLRNVARTGPYMHDGRFKTLAEVVDFYDRGGDRPGADTLRPLGLSAFEKADLVAFLDALSSSLPQVRRPALPPESDEPPELVSGADAAAPPRAPPATDRREPPATPPASPPAETLAQACLAPALERVTRALAAAGSPRAELFDDAVRAHVYRALAGAGGEACAPLRGLQHVSSGLSQSAEFFCRDWYHELELVRSAADPAAFEPSCRRAYAWSYRDLGEDEVSAVCAEIAKGLSRPAALCAALAPRFIDARLKSACEREFRLLGGTAYSCPDSADRPWTQRRCEEYSLFHKARIAADPAVCGRRELCRALAGEAPTLARGLEEDVLARACGRR